VATQNLVFQEAKNASDMQRPMERLAMQALFLLAQLSFAVQKWCKVTTVCMLKLK